MYPDPSISLLSAYTLTHIKCIDNQSVPDLETIRKHLNDEGTISKIELIRLIKDTTRVFSMLL